MIAAELKGGSIAVFPTPHSFYWARESSQNLGHGWYRKDTAATFSLGVQQAEKEEDLRVLPQLHALQRALRHVAADAGVSPRHC